MADAGYILLHRSLLGHAAFRNDAEAMAFAWMIARASWKPVRLRYKGRAVSLIRGQLCVSQRDMADALDRDKAWIERLWRRLTGEAMIEARREAAAMVITICNYDVYQRNAEEREAIGEADGEIGARQGRGRREAQNKEGNKGKEEKKEDSPPIRAQGLPADFEPALTKAAQSTVDGWPLGMFDRELAQFKDRAVAKGETYKDWQAAFRTWISNAEKWRIRNGGYRNGSGANGSASTRNGFLDAARQAADRGRPSDDG